MIVISWLKGPTSTVSAAMEKEYLCNGIKLFTVIIVELDVSEKVIFVCTWVTNNTYRRTTPFLSSGGGGSQDSDTDSPDTLSTVMFVGEVVGAAEWSE